MKQDKEKTMRDWLLEMLIFVEECDTLEEFKNSEQYKNACQAVVSTKEK